MEGPDPPEKRMTERKYIFTIARFRCGCVYRIVGDTAVFCPQHREIITGTERIETPEPETPDVPGLVMNQYVKGIAHTLMNTPRNSLHTMTSVLDGRGDEWAEPSEDLVGMCAACFIDQEEQSETGVAMCECGDKDCSYRWCGSAEGLHAFWRLHVLGKSEETAGIPETDIFSHGQYSTQNSRVTAVLDRERKELEDRAQELMKEMENAREEAGTSEQAGGQPSPYLIAWLDREYQAIKGDDDPREREAARRQLTRKITRLQIIGALPAAQPPTL